jgi:hypothetical membrane protein
LPPKHGPVTAAPMASIIMWGMTSHRAAAVAAALTVTAGAATMLAALVAGPDPWWLGYVSETGTGGRPHAVAYRCGLVILALGVALLAAALRPARPRDRRPAAGLCLIAAAVLAATSGVVPCSEGCPLPPHEATTATDVVHTAASILGMFLLAAAMAVTWLTGPRFATRRLAATALVLMVPLGAGLGLTMVIAGRGALGAILERLVLVVAVSWLVGTALLTASGPPAAPSVDRGRR